LTKLNTRPTIDTVGNYESEWRAFENNEVTHSTAHYLLAVAGFEKNGQPPRAADVARQLNVSRAAVSLQLRALREHGLVEVGENSRLSLTRLGAGLVARIASKREVMRVVANNFLHRFDEATAHCPPGAHCGLCDEVCLLRLMDGGKPADPPPAG